jgi:hypothetical protein
LQTTSRQAEVEFGVRQERKILRRWRDHTRYFQSIHAAVAGPERADFDFLLLDRDWMLLAYLEVKVRRVRIADYGDVITPIRKHHLALRLREHRIRFLMTTLYACGTLIELDLSEKPSRVAPMKRRDREQGSDHAFYGPGQFTVLVEGAPS